MDKEVETWKQKGRKAQAGKLGKKIRSGLARNFQNAKTSSSPRPAEGILSRSQLRQRSIIHAKIGTRIMRSSTEEVLLAGLNLIKLYYAFNNNAAAIVIL